MRPRTFVVCLILTVWVNTSVAADWPQWRHDANRSGATEDGGPDEPGLLWHKSLPHPDPAYDHQYRMCADVTYAPIAAEGLLFVPSNVTDHVLPCDLKTGAVKWRYVTEGPVRFAAVYEDGKVYFGSDDGYLYCVRARVPASSATITYSSIAMPRPSCMTFAAIE